jgi:hypothetical protein
MSAVIVAGNGQSRKTIDLDNTTVPIIGCNAIHRDHHVDHLIACDRRMLLEAVNSEHTRETKIYVRPENYHHFRKMVKDKRIQKLPELPYRGQLRQDDPQHWGSGGFAVLLAAQLDFDEICLVGFDLYGIDDLVNNVYKDTQNYLKSHKPAVDPSYWIYQIAKVFESYPDKHFAIYNNADWIMPGKWRKSNVEQRFLSSLTVDNKYVSCILQTED